MYVVIYRISFIAYIHNEYGHGQRIRGVGTGNVQDEKKFFEQKMSIFHVWKIMICDVKDATVTLHQITLHSDNEIIYIKFLMSRQAFNLISTFQSNSKNMSFGKYINTWHTNGKYLFLTMCDRHYWESQSGIYGESQLRDTYILSTFSPQYLLRIGYWTFHCIRFFF